MRVTPEGWLAIDVTDGMLEEAHRMRAKRDLTHGNTCARRDRDAPWVGDLGEIICNQWLWTCAAGFFEWFTEEPKGKPDFILHGVRVDVKSQRLRRGRFGTGYGVVAHKHHVEKPVADTFLFGAYTEEYREMLFLGGIAAPLLLEHGKLYLAGETMPPALKLQPDHPGLYKIKENRLTRPLPWLEGLLS